MWSRRRSRAVVLALAATATAWGAGGWLGALPAGAAGTTSGRLVLDGQSQWVTPASPGAPGTFTLDLSARGAPTGAQVAVQLYPRLDARDHFEEVVDRGPRNAPISQTSPAPLAALPADPATPGARALTLQVVTTPSTGGQRLGLSCSAPTSAGTCTGVYPVAVALLDGAGAVLHRFTTFLTFSAGTSATPLEFAFVVPVSAPVSVVSAPATPGAALGTVSRPRVSALAQLVGALHAAPSVPVTVEASPQTLEALEASGATGRDAVAALAALSANPSLDEVPAAPYVPVDLAALGAAGEPTEIKAQMAAGATVLHKLHVQTASGLPWIATGPGGKGLGSGLSTAGASQVVVQDTSLAPTPTAPSFTWASTFHLALTGSGRPVDAAESDSFLDGQFRHDDADPALAASQVLADLAMVHFERPYTTHVRGMVAVPPAGWTPNPTFVRTLLAGLDGNPLVSPVTLSRFFSDVTATGSRTLQPGTAGPALIGRSLARSLSSARVRLSQFTEAVKARPLQPRPPVLGDLDHLLLASESDQLVHPSPAAAVAIFDRALARQLGKVSFAAGTVTLTARTGAIPITVVSRAPYTIVGTLKVSGAKFTFPGRTADATHTLVLDHATNTWKVNVTARTSGELPLDVRFVSRTGLVIAQAQLEVRSTATSLVGVLLTALALAVLLAWWARTWRTKRRRRRQAEPVEQADHVTAGAR